MTDRLATRHMCHSRVLCFVLQDTLTLGEANDREQHVSLTEMRLTQALAAARSNHGLVYTTLRAKNNMVQKQNSRAPATGCPVLRASRCHW